MIGMVADKETHGEADCKLDSTKKRAARGWPVVATGISSRSRRHIYHRQRALWNLPEESPDFSFNDAFDLLDCALKWQTEKNLSAVQSPRPQLIAERQEAKRKGVDEHQK